MRNPFENLEEGRPKIKLTRAQSIGILFLVALAICTLPFLVGMIAKLVYYGFNLI